MREIPGLLITFEGIDGVGKSTQLERAEVMLASRGFTVQRVREPGGTAISEQIRALLLDNSRKEMADLTELMLYEASRAQLTAEVIVPALAEGSIVLCDRFYDSTVAYQSFGRGIDRTTVERLNMIATAGLEPDLTILLDLAPQTSFERATQEATDRVEAVGLEFQERVSVGFATIAQEEPHRVKLVDASGTPEEVEERIAALLDEVLSERQL